jgi:hypothetical protein
LQSARDAQAAALVKKGVNVPAGAGFEDFPSLTEAIPSGGSDAVYSGSFVPADNILNVRVDIGGEYSHFVLYANKKVTDFSVKATGGLIIDRKIPFVYGLATSNSGTGFSTVFTITPTSATVRVNNTEILIGMDYIGINTSSPSGTCLGYFLGGVTYYWFAW